MKNRILLIARNEKTYSIRRIKEELSKKSTSYDYDVVQWRSMSFRDGTLYFQNELVDIEKYSAVFFQMPIYYAMKNGERVNTIKALNELFLLSKIFKKSGARFINGEVVFNIPYFDKFMQTYFLAEQGISFIPTLHLIDNNSEKAIETLKKSGFGYPVVIKESFGGVGDDVYKLDNESKVAEFLDKRRHLNLIMQPYIKNDCDYRVIFCRGRSLGIMKRVAKKGYWKNNFSLGASVEKHEDSEMERFAEEACKKMKFDYAGVDVLKTEKGYMIIEINLIPNFKGFEQVYSNANVAQKIVEMLVEQ